jgi:hypothetical protein
MTFKTTGLIWDCVNSDIFFGRSFGIDSDPDFSFPPRPIIHIPTPSPELPTTLTPNSDLGMVSRGFFCQNFTLSIAFSNRLWVYIPYISPCPPVPYTSGTITPAKTFSSLQKRLLPAPEQTFWHPEVSGPF